MDLKLTYNGPKMDVKWTKYRFKAYIELDIATFPDF